MQKRVITNLLILVMAMLTGMSSQVPVVLCFGEDGHVLIELVEFSHHHNHPPNSPTLPGDISCDTNGCNDCGNCTDITIVSQEFIQNTGLSTKSLVSGNAASAFFHIVPETTYGFAIPAFQRISTHFSLPMNPAVNRLLEKMCFLI